jgi:hypothetical protein
MPTCIPCGCDGEVVVQARTRLYYRMRSLCFVAQDGDSYYGTAQVVTQRQIWHGGEIIQECTVTSTVTATDTHCDFPSAEEPPPDCCTEPEPVVSEPCGEDLPPCPNENPCNAIGEQNTILSEPRSPPGAPPLLAMGDWGDWVTVAVIAKNEFRGPELAAAFGAGGGEATVAAHPSTHERGRTVVELRLAPGTPKIPVVARFHLKETPDGGGAPSFSTQDVVIPKNGSTVIFEPPFPGVNGTIVGESSEFFVPGEL